MLEKISDTVDEHQFGALQGRSTTHKLINILRICHQAADNHLLTRTKVFIDVAKAVDCVDRSTVQKNDAAWFSTMYVIRWMHSFPPNRQKRMKLNNVTSNWATMNDGVPQGTWLGPCVLHTHISDLQTTQPNFKFIDYVTVFDVTDHPQQQPKANSNRWDSHVVNWQPDECKYLENKAYVHQLLCEIISGSYLRAYDWQLPHWTSDFIQAAWNDSLKRPKLEKPRKRNLHESQQAASLFRNSQTVIYDNQWPSAKLRNRCPPVTKYACPVRQFCSTNDEYCQLENIQKRVIQIIFWSNDNEFYCSFMFGLDVRSFG